MPDIRGPHVVLPFVTILAALAVAFGCGRDIDKIPAAPVVDSTPPAVPEGLVATLSDDGAVLLHWDANLTDPDLVGYLIYRSEQVVGGFRTRHSEPLATNAWRDGSVRPNGTYVYRVAARDASTNESAMSRECRVTIPGVMSVSGR